MQQHDFTASFYQTSGATLNHRSTRSNDIERNFLRVMMVTAMAWNVNKPATPPVRHQTPRPVPLDACLAVY